MKKQSDSYGEDINNDFFKNCLTFHFMEGLSFDQDKEADRRYRDMKINQVAELAGMTSKNIRFYEDQG